MIHFDQNALDFLSAVWKFTPTRNDAAPGVYIEGGNAYALDAGPHSAAVLRFFAPEHVRAFIPAAFCSRPFMLDPGGMLAYDDGAVEFPDLAFPASGPDFSRLPAEAIPSNGKWMRAGQLTVMLAAFQGADVCVQSVGKALRFTDDAGRELYLTPVRRTDNPEIK